MGHNLWPIYDLQFGQNFSIPIRTLRMNGSSWTGNERYWGKSQKWTFVLCGQFEYVLILLISNRPRFLLHDRHAHIMCWLLSHELVQNRRPDLALSYLSGPDLVLSKKSGPSLYGVPHKITAYKNWLIIARNSGAEHSQSCFEGVFMKTKLLY